MLKGTPYTQPSPALSRERGRAVWGNRNGLLNPVLNVKSFDVAEMLYVVCHYGQSSSLCSATDEQIELLNQLASILQAYLLFGVNIDAVSKRKHMHFLHEIINQLQVVFHVVALKGTIAQFGQHDIAYETMAVSYFVQLLRHLAVLAKVEHTDTRVKQISLHNSISRLLGVLLSRISLIISSVDRLSFQAPANRSAQPVSVFSVLVGVRLFTYFNTLVSKVSSVAISPMARYSSAFYCNAVIILTFLISAANIL